MVLKIFNFSSFKALNVNWKVVSVLANQTLEVFIVTGIFLIILHLK